MDRRPDAIRLDQRLRVNDVSKGAKEVESARDWNANRGELQRRGCAHRWTLQSVRVHDQSPRGARDRLGARTLWRSSRRDRPRRWRSGCRCRSGYSTDSSRSRIPAQPPQRLGAYNWSEVLWSQPPARWFVENPNPYIGPSTGAPDRRHLRSEERRVGK